MFLCWFTSMYSDKKMNLFFFFTFYDIFCTFLTIIFRRSTQNGCFLHFFFFIVQLTGIHLYYLVAVILKAYVLCLAVFISTLPPTWIRQFRIGSVKRLYLSRSSFPEYRISNSPPPPKKACFESVQLPHWWWIQNFGVGPYFLCRAHLTSETPVNWFFKQLVEIAEFLREV